jgi:two-component system LytT family response regulator
MPENYRCLLIDDEPNATQALAAMIAMKCPQLLVLEQINSAKDAVEKIQKWKPDLIFLDVEMPFLNGFELLQQLPNIDFQVIFTTSHEKYAIRAIKFAAIDYLLKPIDLEELQASVAKFEKQKNQVSNDAGIEQFKQLFQNLQSPAQGYTKISLPTFEGLRIVTLSDIVRCEGDGSYTTFHLNTGEKIVSSKNLKEYEDLLESTHFMRVHNSHIINLKEVAAYTKGDGGFVTLSDKSSVDIARRRKEAFLEKIKHLF